MPDSESQDVCPVHITSQPLYNMKHALRFAGFDEAVIHKIEMEVLFFLIFYI